MSGHHIPDAIGWDGRGNSTLVECKTSRADFADNAEKRIRSKKDEDLLGKGMSRKVTLLLVGDGAGRNKTSKANELGIRQEGKEWLIAALASGGLTLGASGMPDASEMLDEL